MESIVLYLAIVLTFTAGGMAYLQVRAARRHRADFEHHDGLLATLLKNHSEMVAFTDPNGVIVFPSDRFEELLESLGIAKRPVSFKDLFSTRDRYKYEHILKYVYRERRALVDRSVTITDGDIDRDLNLSIVPVLDSSGTIVNLLHVLRPARDKARLASDLGHIEKLTNIGQIAAGMAHELNTPLGSIILSTDIIEEELESSHSVSDEVRKIRAQADHCSKVVKQLLSYVRKDADLRSEHELGTVIEKVEELVATEARKRNITIETTSTPDHSIILCNENQIEQLFFNLISNAFHAVGRDSVIRIRIGYDDLLDQVTVSLKDRGCGIPEDQIGEIFDPFFTTKSGKEGTGLGLALCKKIMLEHGGRIAVESTVGQGTTVKLYFPAAI